MIPPAFGVLATSSGVFTTWNPLDKNAAISLSPSLLIATGSSGGNHVGVRSTSSKSSGQWHIEQTPTGTFSVPGLAPAGASLSQFPGNGPGVGLISDGRVFINGLVVDVIEAWSSGNVVAFEYAASSNNVWIQIIGNTRHGPYSLGATGPCFIFGDVFNNGDTMTLNAGQSPFSLAPTVGFLPWTA